MPILSAEFFRAHRAALFAGGAGAVGVAYGARQGVDESAGQDAGTRIETTGHHAAAAGLAAVGLGAVGYAGRGMLKSAGWNGAKRAGAWYTGGMTAAFGEKSIANAFGHRPLAMTVGALAGIGLGSVLGDGDPGTLAKGAGLGMLAGAVAYPVVRNISSDWKAIGRFGSHPRLGSLAKTGIYIGAAVGVGLAARAVMHQPEYETNDVAASDGMGGYAAGNEAGPSLRDRLTRLHGTGDVVLGLHNQRRR